MQDYFVFYWPRRVQAKKTNQPGPGLIDTKSEKHVDCPIQCASRIYDSPSAKEGRIL